MGSFQPWYGRTIFCASALLLLANTARASTILIENTTATPGSNFPAICKERWDIGKQVATGKCSAESFDASAGASAKAFTEGNALKAVAEAFASATWLRDSTSHVTSTASATAEGFTTDWVLVDGSGRFEMTFLLDGATSSTCGPGSNAIITARSHLGSVLYDQSINECGTSNGVSKIVTMNLAEGVRLGYSASLKAVASATASGSGAPGSEASVTERSHANGSRSLYLFIKPLTPGASYISESGIDYTRRANVPEPAMFSLLTLAGALVGVRRLRLRHQ